jgi:hypothetical protein
VNDRVGAGDALELRVVPVRALGALVLAVPDLHRACSSAAAAVGASKTSWIISQSPSWRLFQSLKT